MQQAAATVSTSATLVVTAPNGGYVTVKNEDASIAIFVGGSTVTNSGGTAGVKVAALGTLTLPVKDNEPVYACSASGTPTVSYVFSA